MFISSGTMSVLLGATGEDVTFGRSMTGPEVDRVAFVIIVSVTSKLMFMTDESSVAAGVVWPCTMEGGDVGREVEFLLGRLVGFLLPGGVVTGFVELVGEGGRVGSSTVSKRTQRELLGYTNPLPRASYWLYNCLLCIYLACLPLEQAKPPCTESNPLVLNTRWYTVASHPSPDQTQAASDALLCRDVLR